MIPDSTGKEDADELTSPHEQVKFKIIHLSALIVLISALSGCATISATRAGEKFEVIWKYEEIYLSGETLIVRYSTSSGTTMPFQSDSRSIRIERWATASLVSMTWVPLENLDRVSVSKLHIEEARPSEASDPTNKLILHELQFRPVEDQIHALENAHIGPVSVHVMNDNPLHLVRDDPNNPEKLLVARASPPTNRHYDEDWAPFARVVLVPVALVVDVVTAPIQIVVFFIFANMAHHQ